MSDTLTRRPEEFSVGNQLDLQRLGETEYLQQHQLSEQVLNGESTELDLRTLSALETSENGQVLLAVVRAGLVPIKIYGQLGIDGDLVEEGFFVAHEDYSPEFPVEAAGEIVPNALLLPKNNELLLGRTGAWSKNLGLQNFTVSKDHLHLELGEDGYSLSVKDKNSKNGIHIITKPKSDVSFDPEITVELKKNKLPIGESALEGASIEKPELITEVPGYESHNNNETEKSLEIQIDKVTYRKLGIIKAGKQDGLLVMESTDEKGKATKFFVYKSSSEGGLRVSQGRVPGKDGSMRYMKGAERAYYFQYTQDTQLHPELAAFVAENQADMPELTIDTINIDKSIEEQLQSNFEDQVQHFSLFDAELTKILNKVPAGKLTKDHLATTLEIPIEELSDGLRDYVNKLNAILYDKGVLPDFEHVTRTKYDIHPILGKIKKEIFTIKSGNDVREWHMASDEMGRVWIDRIRLQSSRPTAYGTDNKVVISGILTSKPLDYPEQVTGLDDRYVQDMPSGYKDISTFLDELLPIQRYRMARKVSRNS